MRIRIQAKLFATLEKMTTFILGSFLRIRTAGRGKKAGTEAAF
jgi:hypothetical protein